MKVAILHQGEIVIHAEGVLSDYDSLCGVDGNDPCIGHELTSLPKKAKINCRDCIALITAAKKYKSNQLALEKDQKL